MFRTLAIVVPFVAMMASAALADTPQAQLKAEPEVKKLLLLMDRDQNGKVSRDEFMAFMSAEFDRLDVNKDGQLDVHELTALRVSSRHPGGAGSK